MTTNRSSESAFNRTDSGYGLEFISRSLRTTAIVLLILAPFGLFYFGLWKTLSFFSGGIWGILNLLFITALVKAALRPGGMDTLRALGWAIIKFPLLYATGYFLLKVDQFYPLALVLGSALALVIIVLKVLGRALVNPRIPRTPDTAVS